MDVLYCNKSLTAGTERAARLRRLVKHLCFDLSFFVFALINSSELS
jgi:hypothetical protein